MNSTLTLNANTAAAKTSTVTLAQIGRTLACKWDMFAVIGLMASSALYSAYALAQMTGF